MKNTNPEFDAYIEGAAEFARPILTMLRRAFHKACPRIEETMKWSAPHFEYNGIVGSMAAFKKHAAFCFWKGKEMSDPHGLFSVVGKTSMSSMKVTTVDDLPADKVLAAYIKEAVKLNQDTPQSTKKKAKKKTAKKKPKNLEVPNDLMKALKRNKKALSTFEDFSHTNKREYVEWITGAKREATREKRLAQAIEWMAEGKPRNWKYMNC